MKIHDYCLKVITVLFSVSLVNLLQVFKDGFIRPEIKMDYNFLSHSEKSDSN